MGRRVEADLLMPGDRIIDPRNGAEVVVEGVRGLPRRARGAQREKHSVVTLAGGGVLRVRGVDQVEIVDVAR